MVINFFKSFLSNRFNYRCLRTYQKYACIFLNVKWLAFQAVSFNLYTYVIDVLKLYFEYEKYMFRKTTVFSNEAWLNQDDTLVRSTTLRTDVKRFYYRFGHIQEFHFISYFLREAHGGGGYREVSMEWDRKTGITRGYHLCLTDTIFFFFLG